MKRKIICLNIGILTILTFFSCENKNVIISNNFQDEWYSSYEYLVINSNSTFEYIRSNCVSSTVSKGKWKIINDTLILNSYHPKGCYFIEDFIQKPPTRKDSIRQNIITKNIKDCIPNTGYVYFRNEKFYLKDSLLISKSYTSFNEDSKELNYIHNFQKTPYYDYR